jgi:hypothetical protein
VAPTGKIMKDEMDEVGGTYVAAKKYLQNASQKPPREVTLGGGLILNGH